MQKLVLAGMVVLLFGAALPAMAAPTLTTSGEVTYGVISDFSATTDSWPNAYLNFVLDLDENNAMAVELYANSLPTISTAVTGETGKLVPPNVGFWYLKSDLGGVLGLDKKMVDPVLYGGYGVFDLPSYTVTQYGSEGISAIGIDNGARDGIFGSEAGSAYGLVGVNVGVMEKFSIVAAASGTAFNPVSATNAPQALVGAYGTVGPVSVEAGWTLSNTAKGLIPLGVKLSQPFGDFAVAGVGQYVVNLNTGGASNWSAGAQASYKGNYTVDFAVMSFEPTAGTMAVKGTGDVIVNLTKDFGVIGSAWLNFNPAAASVFDTAEASVWKSFGPTKVRVGYLYGTQGAGNLGTPNLNAPGNNGGKGGLFLTTDISF